MDEWRSRPIDGRRRSQLTVDGPPATSGRRPCSGEIDVATSPQLRNELNTLIATGARPTSRSSSAACRSSTRRASACSSARTSACAKTATGTIRIVGAQPSVRKVFEITGLEAALLDGLTGALHGLRAACPRPSGSRRARPSRARARRPSGSSVSVVGALRLFGRRLAIGAGWALRLVALGRTRLAARSGRLVDSWEPPGRYERTSSFLPVAGDRRIRPRRRTFAPTRRTGHDPRTSPSTTEESP